MTAPVAGWRLRSYLVGLLLTLVMVISVPVVGLVVLWQLPRVDADTKLQVESDARVVVHRAAALARAVQRRLSLVGATLETLPAASQAAFVQQVCAEDAMMAGLAIEAGADGGAGLAPLRCAGAADGPVHRFTRPLQDGRLLVLTFSQAFFLDEVMAPFLDRYQIAFERTRVTVRDAQGRVLAHADGTAQQSGPAGQPSGPPAPGSEHLVEAPTELFGWTVVASAPAGWNHPRMQRSLWVSGAATLANLLLGLALAPLWSRRMVRAMDPLVQAARKVAQGRMPEAWPQGPLRELNVLSNGMAAMATSLAQRQQDLQTLNAELEQRVAQRTEALAATNAELKQSFAHLQAARAELERTEKLASLGGLVAGVAHELNTPLGNGVMAVSTLRDDLHQFQLQLRQGLRQSALDKFVQSVEVGTGIASRNLERAADLVTSFKQIAVDQTSGQRRRFELQTLGHEVLLTLRPSFARTPYTVDLDIASGLVLDSYPGALGQILTNLITNAIVHGFDGRDHGRILVQAQALADDQVELTVADDGQGIASAVIDRLFQPFVTTRMGRGGTGLGLHIAHTAASHVLGGALTVRSTAGQGTVFTLRLPRTAPSGAVPAQALAQV